MDIETLCSGHDFERLVVVREPAGGVVAFVVVDSTRRGPAFGGIRRWRYQNADAGLADALRLAAAMTLKCAIAGIAGGGGKAVILDHPGLDRVVAYRALGRAVAGLGGVYYTGPDVGTSAADLEVVAAETEFVATPSAACGDLAEPTAEGVLAGIEAVARELEPGRDLPLRGMRVAVQGVGGVGGRVARRLVGAGAQVTVADVDARAVAALRDELGVAVVDPAEVVATPCEIFAPCALGQVVDAQSIDRIQARAIAGSANNVLAGPELGVALHERGVLYAPDFVINAGALIHGATFHLEGAPPKPDRVRALGGILTEVFGRSRDEGVPPEQVALTMAREVLDRSERSV